MTTSLTRAATLRENSSSPRIIQQALLRAVTYADMFDDAKSTDELYRVLDTPGISQAECEQGLQDLLAAGILHTCDGRWMLAGRAELLSVWRRRREESERKWQAARRYTGWIRCLPFVRMVAVTGTLAAQSAEAADDIDLFLITAPGRVWLTRALTILVVRWAALFGETLCPNYLIASDALVFVERNLYSARELAQMQSLYGKGWFTALWEQNPWVLDYLPNVQLQQTTPLPLERMPFPWRAIKRGGEWLLGGWLGGTMEHWEMQRKMTKLLAHRTPVAPEEARFSPAQCKGHFEGHSARILQHYHERLAALAAEQE